jgi:hypothetical protein
MHCIRRTLGRITPCRSCGERHSSLSGVPLTVEKLTPEWKSEGGNGTCPEFQGPTMCAPCVGIVPCAGVDCPKMGLPPYGKATDEKVFLPNVSFQENGVKPTSILCAGGR